MSLEAPSHWDQNEGGSLPLATPQLQWLICVEWNAGGCNSQRVKITGGDSRDGWPFITATFAKSSVSKPRVWTWHVLVLVINFSIRFCSRLIHSHIFLTGSAPAPIEKSEAVRKHAGLRKLVLVENPCERSVATRKCWSLFKQFLSKYQKPLGPGQESARTLLVCVSKMNLNGQWSKNATETCGE